MSALGSGKPESNGVESAVQPGPVFARSQSVVSRLIGGETLAVPVRGKVGDLASIYSFNEIGSLLWELLHVPRNLAELLAAVEREYDVESETARQDVERFLSDMISAGLVEVRPAAAVAATDPAERG